MQLDRKELKRQARQAMRAARLSPIVVVLVLSVFSIILGLLTMSLSGRLSAFRDMYAAAMAGQMPVIPETNWTGGTAGWILGIALEVMSIELSVGFVIYSLQLWRREKAGVGNLFDSFGMFFKSIWITIIPSLLISLWSIVYVIPVTMLLVMTDHYWWLVAGLPLMIPMYMAAYSYSLSTYIMIENPGLSSLACVAMSRIVMRGRRWKRFVLDLSFLGWALLYLIPVGICGYLWVKVYDFLVLGGVLMLCLIPVGIGVYLWLKAYMQTAYAGFYDWAVQDYMQRNAPPMEQPPEM